MSECLSCLDLTKRFGAKEALRSVNFKLEKGRIVGLLGPNGSGKTTLLKLVSGLLQPTDGSVLIEGMPPGIETKRKVSYLPDQMYLGDWMRVRDIIEYFQDFMKILTETGPGPCWKLWGSGQARKSGPCPREPERRCS